MSTARFSDYDIELRKYALKMAVEYHGNDRPIPHSQAVVTTADDFFNFLLFPTQEESHIQRTGPDDIV